MPSYGGTASANQLICRSKKKKRERSAIVTWVNFLTQLNLGLKPKIEKCLQKDGKSR